MEVHTSIIIIFIASWAAMKLSIKLQRDIPEYINMSTDQHEQVNEVFILLLLCDSCTSSINFFFIHFQIFQEILSALIIQI